MVLAASAAMAAPRGGGGHFASMPSHGGGRPFIHNAMGPSNGHWNGGHWGGDWHHHDHHDHHGHNDVVFIGGFGFPFWGWGWGYPYGYYGYYPYGYYGGGYSPYGYYGGNGYGYNGDGYGYSNHSRVAEMQRQLAHAGYYHGTIDGIIGPQTRRALRAYRLDHGTGTYAE